MARKSMGKAAKVLGGLGAAYVASELAKDKIIDLHSPEQKAQALNSVAQIPRHVPSDAEQAKMVREGARRRAGLPVVTDEEQARIFSDIKNLARTESGVPIRTSDGFLGTQYKKGGAVKGWGKARGARAAKVY